jgi:phenylalanyl-tRNA synthetase beta chain
VNISLNWLKDFVEIKEDVHQLAELFNIHSAEVEAVRKLVDANQLMVGKVLKKEPHENADKLSVCQVELKDHTDQIVCGAPNVQEGQMVVVALPGAVLPGDFKIKSSTIRGVTSNGMICSLTELGIDKKYADASGIYVIQEPCDVGDDPLKVLSLDDETIEIDILPNRPDLLSMMGVTYDVGAILSRPVSFKEVSFETVDEQNDVTLKLSTEYCQSYYARILNNAVIKPAPRWMQSRLIAAGIRPINNVVDITNYVMLETGQPLHAFDYDLLDSNLIDVRLAKEGETLRTLDEVERLLTKDDIVITNGKKAVALGGVMGGYDTEISSSTKRILLESAVFDPTHIRKTSSRLNLRSEASIRFERKVDPKRTQYALELATYYFNKYANADVYKGVSKIDHTDYSDKVISITESLINSNLGTSLLETDIERIMNRLQFKVESTTEGMNIHVPSRRQDIETYQDIIEEVGRIIGYDALPTTLPTTIQQGRLSPFQQFRRVLKSRLTALGLSETLTYSLTQEECLYDFSLEKETAVNLQLPMSQDKAVLRLSQLPHLCDVITYNQARKVDDVAIFEIGKAYHNDQERELLSGALTGTLSQTPWKNEMETVDFYVLKGLLESLFESLSLGHLTFEATSKYDALHPGQTAVIKDFNNEMGFIGKLHPEYAKKRDLEAVYVFELDVVKLFNSRRVLRSAKEVNKYPSITRDLSVVLERNVLASDLIKHIQKSGKRMLESVEITDLYQGKPLEDHQKSITVHLTFTDVSKTLKAEEVDQRVNVIVADLRNHLKAIIRDY